MITIKLIELDDLIRKDTSISNDRFRIFSRMIKISHVFNDSYDSPDYFENISFGGDKLHKVSEVDKINKVLTDIYNALENSGIKSDYDLLLEELVDKINSEEIDYKKAKMQLISIGSAIGVLPNFYSVYDEYLEYLYNKKLEKNNTNKKTI